MKAMDLRWSRVSGGLFLSVLLCFGGVLSGADGSVADRDAAEVQRLQSLEVHGRSADDPVVAPLAAPASQELSISEVDREEIHLTRPRLAIDSLNYTPSFQILRKGRKNPVGLTIRGAGNVNVLFDGLHIGTKEDTRFIDFLPADILETVRVIRDSTGLIYGPPQLSGPGGVMGFGGVIDLALLEPPEGHHGGMRLEMGRYNEFSQHIHAAGMATDRLGYVISADRDSYDGPGNENMGHQYHHVLGRLIYTYFADSTITLNLLRTDGERELQKAGPGMVFTGWREEYSPWEMTTLTLSLNHLWTPDVSTTVETYYRDYEATYHRYDLGTEDDLRETKKGIHVRQTVSTLDRNTLRVGAEYAEWTNPTGKLYYIGSERREKDFSAYLQDSWEAIPDRLTVDAGVRWDRSYLDEGVIANGPGFVAGRPVLVNNDWEDPSLSYSAGARLQVTASQTATARWALSRQSADSDSVGAGGSSLEDPEEARYEVGYGVEFNPALTVTVTGFYSSMSDGLVYAGPVMVSGQQRPSWRNADLERMGLEVSAEGALTESLAYFVNATWMNATVEPAGMDEDHDDRVPRYLAAGGLRFRRGPWLAALSLKYAAEFEDTFATRPLREVDLGDYWLLQANAGYTFTLGETFEHEVYGGVRNGFNQHYTTSPGYDDPGRSFYVGYALRW